MAPTLLTEKNVLCKLWDELFTTVLKNVKD
jgi:hypothetical protein